jgi:hypothetical protein
MKAPVFIVFFVFLNFQFAFGQKQVNWEVTDVKNAAIEIKAASEKFMNMQQYSSTLVYQTFAGHNSQIAVETKSSLVLKLKDAWYSQMEGVVTLQKNKMVLTIDSVERNFVIAKPSGHSAGSVLDERDIIGLLSTCKNVSKAVIDGHTAYRLNFKKGGAYERIDLILDQKTFFKKIILFMENSYPVSEENPEVQEKPRLEISLVDFSETKRIDKSLFELSTYIIVKDNKITPSRNYQDYTISDTRLNQKL